MQRGQLFIVTGSGGGAVINSSGGGDICEEDTVSGAQSLASTGKAGEAKLVWGHGRPGAREAGGLGTRVLYALLQDLDIFL